MKFESLNRIMDSLNEEETEQFMDCRFPNILAKVELYLRIGPEKYRTRDFFGMPDPEWDAEDLKIIEDKCRQVLEGKGFRPEKPFRGLHVMEFSGLFSLFHFEQTGKETSSPETGKFLDKMTMRHFMEGGEVTYYNLVEYDQDATDDPKKS